MNKFDTQMIAEAVKEVLIDADKRGYKPSAPYVIDKISNLLIDISAYGFHFLLGDKFKINGELYILARGGDNSTILVNLKTGGIWTSPISFVAPYSSKFGGYAVPYSIVKKMHEGEPICKVKDYQYQICDINFF